MFEKATTLTFDVVGTLIDFETGILNFWKPILRHQGIEMPDEVFLAQLGEAEAELQRCRPDIPYTGMLPLIYWRLANQLGFQSRLRKRAD